MSLPRKRNAAKVIRPAPMELRVLARLDGRLRSFFGLFLTRMPGVAALQPARFALGLRAVFRTTPGLPSS